MDGLYSDRYKQIWKSVTGNDVHCSHATEEMAGSSRDGHLLPGCRCAAARGYGSPATAWIRKFVFSLRVHGVYIAGSDYTTWESICGGWRMNLEVFQKFGDEDR